MTPLRRGKGYTGLALALALVILVLGAAPVRSVASGLMQTEPPTKTPLPTATPLPQQTEPPTKTPLPTATPTPLPTKTPLPTATPTPEPTRTPLPTATPASLPTRTPRPTNRPSASPTPTATPSPILPTAVATPTFTPVRPVSGAPTATSVIPTEVPTAAPRSPTVPSPTPTRYATRSPTPAPAPGVLERLGNRGKLVLAAGGVAIVGSVVALAIRRRSSGTRTAVRKALPRVRVRPEQVARLVGAFRSVYTVSPEVLQALERALPAVDPPLRKLLKAEIDAYFAGERVYLFSGLPDDVDPGGYLQQFVAVVTAPDATRETLLEALRQLEERLARR